MRPLAIVPVLVLLAVPSGAAAATRFASPAGTGTACVQGARCSLPTAFDGAAAGDTVSVAEGAYALGDRGLSTGARGLTVVGEVTGPRRPAITLGGQVVIGTGSRLIDLGLDFGESGGSLVAQGGTRGIGDRLLVRGSAGTPCLVDSPDAVGLTNSVCATDGEGGGLTLDGRPTGVRGVTALGRGSFGYGAQVVGGSQATLEDTALSGGDANGGDLFVGTRTGVAANVSTRTSAYERTVGAQPASELGRVAAQPVFRDVALRDLRQAAGASTVHAGSATQNGRDLNGNLRTLGARTDIGAYEQVPTAPTVAPPTGTPARRSATVTTSLTLAGGAADAVVELLRVGDPVGAAPVRSAPVRVLPDSATGSQGVTVTVAGLDPDTSYSARVVVTTDGGTATSTAVDLRTLPEPPATTDPAAQAGTGSTTTTPTSTAPATTTPQGPVITPGAGGPAAVPARLSVTLTRSGRRALARAAVRRGGAVVRVGCGQVACSVRLTGVVRAGTRRVGALSAGRTTAGAGATRSVRLKATKALKAALRRKRTLVLAVTASATTADGRRATRTLKIAVK